jgi:hypothetical protein
MMRRCDDEMIYPLQNLEGCPKGGVVLKKYLLNIGHQNIIIKQIKPNIEDCYMNLSQNVSH